MRYYPFLISYGLFLMIISLNSDSEIIFMIELVLGMIFIDFGLIELDNRLTKIEEEVENQ